jgi:DNA-binding transcriptional LysR family regulator
MTVASASCEEEPELAIRLFEWPFAQQLKGLHDDLLDAGLALSNVVNPGLTAEAVWTDPLAVIVPARHPLLAHGRIRLDDALRYPVVLYRPDADSGSHDQIQAVLASATVIPKVVDRVTSLGVMLTLAGAGYGVGFAAASQVRALRRPDVVIRPLAGTPPILTTYLLRRRGEPPAMLKRFIERVKALDTSLDVPDG